MKNGNVQLLVERDDERWYTTLSEFLADNEEDLYVVGEVLALAPGESVSLGGGACPVTTVTRIAASTPSLTRSTRPASRPRATW